MCSQYSTFSIQFKFFWMAEPSAGADPNGAKQSPPDAPHCREVCENQVKGSGGRGRFPVCRCLELLTLR